jgi:hypothetical protein
MMSIAQREGHSAAIDAYLSVGNQRFQVAKLNRDYLTLAEPCELAPKTEARLNITIDSKRSTQTISIDEGIAPGQQAVRYSVLVPF